MSTRTQLEFYDNWGDKKPNWHLGSRLYHHSDGYPSFMYPTIKRFLKKIKIILNREQRSYWWDSERIAGLFVALSKGKYEEPEEKTTSKPEEFGGNYIPRFQPSQEIHGDIEYLYRIKLDEKQNAEIEVLCPQHDKEYDIVGFRKLSKKQLENRLKEK